jgi:flavodoxin I
MAVVDGMFVGLPIDEDNEYDLTEERLTAWVEKLKPVFV